MSTRYKNIHMVVTSLDKLMEFDQVTIKLEPIKTLNVILKNVMYSYCGTATFHLFNQKAQIVKFYTPNGSELFLLTFMYPSKNLITRIKLQEDDVFYYLESDYDTEQTIEDELKNDVPDIIMLVINDKNEYLT